MEFPLFPGFREIEELKKFVDLPGVAFTFVVPHYLARIQQVQTDLETLIADIGALD